MAYTGSKAFQGDGAVLAIGPIIGTSTPTYVPVFEITDTGLPSAAWDKREVSNLNSPAHIKEFRKGMIDNGEISVKGNSVSTDPGQIAIAAAFADSLNGYLFEITMPLQPGQTSTGDVYKFGAMVMGWTQISTINAGKTVEFEAKLQITTAIAITAGS